MITKNKIFDLIIIGGSYSGLSAAMTLGRFSREILVIDHHLPANRFSTYSHNFLTQDGAQQSEMLSTAREQVLKYPTVSLVSDFASSGEQTEEGFTIITKTGISFKSKTVIFATGVKDKLPAIKGFEECWGKSVIHCPYCHGYEL